VHYPIPSNVVALHEVYMQDRLPEAEMVPGRVAPELRRRIYGQLREFYRMGAEEGRTARFWGLVDLLEEAGDAFTYGNLLRDREAWEVLKESYEEFCPDESFIDFFWTSRFLHLPLWALWRSRRLLPKARVYHSVSAGYAGLMAALAARSQQVPYLLTEHGIYTKERITEISQAEWIYEDDSTRISESSGLGRLKQMWINLFAFQGKVAYDSADQIITLYEGNAVLQAEFGADPQKIQVVPNGIEPTKFDGIRDTISARWNPAPERKHVGFVGRVVPIKDVKTLLRAARLVCERCPDVDFLIAGPYAENPAYFDDCQKIVKLLHIEDRVHFLGMQKLMEVLPRMDVMVLTSISEGLPLVVLEAMAAGLPVVATDVGACRELVFGRVPADKALGRAGRLTKILSPQETGAALIHILGNPPLWRQLGAAGRRRAEEFYTMERMLDSYRSLYRDLIGKQPGSVRPQAVPESAGVH
jgi:polysaccharide biosynthesis protein PelF